ncbi:4 [Hexamita inflata]|uniref:4 n=1 Tax=Hexamita inflata TaxID=28002 RepID=A0AA86RKU9_9EUKA|nr:4 [Hexamita inflata] [Hexamita inflata]
MFSRFYSKSRTRLVDNEFDLDLSYITQKIIAMGYPEAGINKLIRNNIDDVERYLDKAHGTSYLVVNLTPTEYDQSRFHGRVMNFAFEDHTAPNLFESVQLIKYLSDFLNQQEQNTIAVHCKAGKGRTGTIISCLLIQMGICASPVDAMKLFAFSRSSDGRAGVENPSQRRFVNTFYVMNQKIRDFYNAHSNLTLQKYNLDLVQTESTFKQLTFCVNKRVLVLNKTMRGYEPIEHEPFSGDVILNGKGVMCQFHTQFVRDVFQVEEDENWIQIVIQKEELDSGQADVIIRLRKVQ